MPGLTRKCREGESFQVGQAIVRVVRTGRKAVINIVAPADMRIEHIAAIPGSSQAAVTSLRDCAARSP